MTTTRKTKTKRVVGYVRVSVDGIDKISPDAQRRSIESYCASKGWELVDVVIERGKSAGEGKKRPKFDRLIDSIETGGYDALIAYRLDRITRSTIDFAGTWQRLAAAGCDIVSVSESFDTTTPMGRAMLQIIIVFAELERSTIQQRARDTNRERRQSGNLTPHGTAAFGYDRVGGRLVIDPVAAEWVRYITDRIIDGGSLRAICHELTAAGAPMPPHTITRATKRGKEPQWLFGGVREVVTRPTIAGLRTDLDGDEPTALIEGGWDPIVEPERWHQMMRILSDPKRRTSKNNPPSLLSGHLICGGIGKDGQPCNAKLRPYMHRHNAHSRNPNALGERRRYKCQASDGYPNACQGNSIDLDPIETYVTDRLLATLADSTIGAIGPIEIHDGDDLDQINERLDELAADWAAGAITRSEWRTARAVLDQRLNDAEQTERRQRARSTTDLLQAHDVASTWAELDGDEKRAVVRDFLKPIVIAPTHRRRFVPIEERVTVELATD